MKRILLPLLFFSAVISSVYAQRRVISIDDLWKFGRVENYAVSPDARWIAYTVTQYSINRNTVNSDIFITSTSGGMPKQLTNSAAYDGHPCWSPDGALISFLSTRNGIPQIFTIPMDGGEAHQITEIPTGVDKFIMSPDGNYFAFSTTACSYFTDLDSSVQKDLERESNPVQSRLIDGLLFRHLERWRDAKKSSLYVMRTSGGPFWKVTPGDYDSPPISSGSCQDFAFSPDSKELAFVRNPDSLTAISTNNDIFVVPAKGGTIRRITQNLANDNQPVYSPDGKYIAFRSMKRPGYDEDQYDLMIYTRRDGRIQNLTDRFDLDVGEISWSPSSGMVYFTSQDNGRQAVFSMEMKSKKITPVVLQGCNTGLQADREDNLYFIRSTINLPHEIFIWEKVSESVFQITFTNSLLLDQLEMNILEEFHLPSYDSKLVHGFLLKPPFFDPAKMYPAVLLIYDSPHGVWQDEFHYGWNAQMFASRGHVVIMINCRGSKGYGQEFCDAAGNNWGGAPYRDLMTVLDNVLVKYPFIQPQRLAAAGSFFGGYMINWMAGHTDRFRCLVSHSGIFNPSSFYGTTQELWFPEWEFDGTPYDNIRNYERWSPLYFAKNMTTPTLVVHGELDFRVAVEQGFQMFTALQRQKVPSKMLYFPDEGQFIQKPLNARLWWQTVLDWIDLWTSK